MRTLLKSKIHRATVTDASVDYEGSVTIDIDLMEAADILQFEQVHVLDITSGARLEMYALEGPRGSGIVSLNGVAARPVQKGDLVLLLAYDQVAEPEARGFRPTLVYVDEKNQISKVGHDVTVDAK